MDGKGLLEMAYVLLVCNDELQVLMSDDKRNYSSSIPLPVRVQMFARCGSPVFTGPTKFKHEKEAVCERLDCGS